MNKTRLNDPADIDRFGMYVNRISFNWFPARLFLCPQTLGTGCLTLGEENNGRLFFPPPAWGRWPEGPEGGVLSI